MVVFHKLVLLVGSVIVVTIYHSGLLHENEVPHDSKETVVVKILCPGNDATAYYRHETDKSLYYKCLDGIGMVMSCPEGHFFYPKLHRCTDSEKGDIPDLVVEKNVGEFEKFVPFEIHSTSEPTTTTRRGPYCTTVFPGSTDYITSTWLCTTIDSTSTYIPTSTVVPSSSVSPDTSTTSGSHNPYPICTTVFPGSTDYITSTWLCTTIDSSTTYVPTSTVVPSSSIPPITSSTSGSYDPNPYCTTVFPGSTDYITSTWLCTTIDSSTTYVPTSTVIPTSSVPPITSSTSGSYDPNPYCTTVFPGSTDYITSTWLCTTIDPSTTYVPTSTAVPTSSIPPITSTAKRSTDPRPYCTTVLPGSTDYITTSWPCNTISPSSSIPSSSTSSRRATFPPCHRTYDPSATSAPAPCPPRTRTIGPSIIPLTTTSSPAKFFPRCNRVTTTDAYGSTVISTPVSCTPYKRTIGPSIYPTTTSAPATSSLYSSTKYPSSSVVPTSSTVLPSSSTEDESTSWISPTSTSAYVVPTDAVSPTVTPVLPNGLPRLIAV